MLHVLVDNSFWFYLFAGFTAVVLGVLWWQHRKKGLLLGLAGVLGFVVFLYVLSLFLVTDRAKIRSVLEEMASAFELQNPDLVVKHLSPKFKHYGLTKKNVAEELQKLENRWELVVIVRRFEFEEVDRDKGYARVSFYVRASAEKVSGMRLYRAEAEFAAEEGRWRMTTFKRFPPFANSDQEIRYPRP